jgi:glycosyltransferase involved in cell wall biosynthesis
MKKHVADKLGLKKIKGKILYYGTDTEFFKPDTDRNIKNEEIIFLQISSFTEKKGHEYTIKAFHKYLQLGSKNSIKAKMILAGDGSLRQSAIYLVEQLKISDKVSFPGIVTKFGARELMMEANIFVHHSITSLTVGDMEGIPNAIMEAMAMELPILSTFHSGIPELVENNLNGYLVEERDIEDFSNKMDLISNWSKLPINREKVEMFFEKNTHQKSLENYYLEALNI